MKKLKVILTGALTVFLALQFTNPARTNPPVKNDLIAATQPPANVAAALRAACYDCHSHETKWPLYSRIAPMSWLIANDVKDGRTNLNLSEWPVDDAKRAARRLENMSEQIGNAEMPPKKYTAIHADARLTESQRKELAEWLDTTADKIKSSAAAEK